MISNVHLSGEDKECLWGCDLGVTYYLEEVRSYPKLLPVVKFGMQNRTLSIDVDSSRSRFKKVAYTIQMKYDVPGMDDWGNLEGAERTLIEGEKVVRVTKNFTSFAWYKVRV